MTGYGRNKLFMFDKYLKLFWWIKKCLTHRFATMQEKKHEECGSGQSLSMDDASDNRYWIRILVQY